MSNNELLKRIDNLESIGRMVVDEATKLRKSLFPVQGRTSRKGLTQQQISRALMKRNKTAFKK